VSPTHHPSYVCVVCVCDGYVRGVSHEYDTITKLDAWKTHFLYNVKEQMAPSAPEGEGGEVDLT